MYLENGRISERQCFRIGVLENIAIGMVAIPYITTKIAGEWHFPALLLGLIFTVLYGGIVFFLSKQFPEGLIEYIHESLGVTGKLIECLYVVRYILRAGVIVLFFGTIIQEYMLRSFNMFWIILPFILISGYGGNKDIEKRGRLIELLFWWMIVPIILVGVFSISNLSIKAIPEIVGTLRVTGGVESRNSIFIGGYLVLLVLSSLELMIFTLARQKKNTWENALKTLLWVIISMVLAHLLIVSVLGREWTGSRSSSVLSVMEASSLPGGAVERLDYPVLAFWIIGVFATVSGYMFYSKELINHISSKEKCEEKLYTMPIVVILLGVAVWLWSKENASEYLAFYLIKIDFWVGLLIPFLVLLIKKDRIGAFLRGTINRSSVSGENSKNKSLRSLTLILFTLIGTFTLSGCRKDDVNVLANDVRVSFDAIDSELGSLENRDYVMTLDIDEGSILGGAYSFEFNVADLTEYKGASEGNLGMIEYECEADSVSDALDKYYEKKNRHLDMGHISLIEFNDDIRGRKLEKIIAELSDMPAVAKSVKVTLNYGEKEVEMNLRELIKLVFDGEDFH